MYAQSNIVTVQSVTCQPYGPSRSACVTYCVIIAAKLPTVL
jgi:hypothetical protein